MPRRVIRPRTRVTRGRRPGGTWARVITEPAAVATSTKVLIATLTLSNPGIGETVRRTVGQVYVISDQTAASEIQAGAFGVIVANDLAIAAGAASIPGPVTDRNDDGWMVWQGFSQQIIVGDATGILRGYVYNFDSRGMRRVEEGFGMAFMVENNSGSNVFHLGLAVSLYATRN